MVSAQQKVELSAVARTATGKHTRALRRDKLVPGVVYGHELQNMNVAVSAAEFGKAYKQAGETTLVNLTVDGKPFNVIIHDVQVNALSQEFEHVDFFRVRLDEAITSSVPLKFIGAAKAVVEQGGVLVKNLDEVQVEALPLDMPREIEVDIATLNTFEDTITIKQLAVSDKVKILADVDEVVALVQAPRSEEELAALEEKVDEKAAVEGIEASVEKGKKEEEGEAGAEGAPAASEATPAEKK